MHPFIRLCVLLLATTVYCEMFAPEDRISTSLTFVENKEIKRGDVSWEANDYLRFTTTFFDIWKQISQKTPPLRPCTKVNNQRNLFYAWMPTTISRSALGTTFTFTQAQNLHFTKLANFTTSVLSMAINKTVLAGYSEYDVWLRTGFILTTKDEEHIQYFESQKLSPNKEYTLSDVSDVVRTNLKENIPERSVIKIEFEVFQINGSEYVYLDFDEIITKPTIIVYMCDYSPDMNPSHSSNDRNIRINKPEDSKMCLKRNFLVKPAEELHWYDVVFPEELDLGRCAGECPFPIDAPTYNCSANTYWQDQYNLINPNKLPDGFQRASCKIAAYKPIDIVLKIEGSNGTLLSLVRAEDLSADFCGCTA